jgi:hypothetical protein
MSRRTLSIATPLVSLFFFSAFVVAGVNVTAIGEHNLPYFPFLLLVTVSHSRLI